MDNFGLHTALSGYCADNGILFIPGTNAYVNASQTIDNTEFSDGNNQILIADFTAAPVIVNGVIQETTYAGLLALGQVIDYDELGDESTRATLDETYQQKIDRRLLDLSNDLATLIGVVACDNELDITNLLFKLDINQFDLNADFVAATITLVA